MKLLVTGYKGQLGYDVVNEAKSRGIEAVGVDIDEMDITNAQQINDVIKTGNYDAVVHCAAWTAVDKAEEPELFDKVRAVNATGTQNIVNVCKELNIPIMYFSTDYVFNGQGTAPWNEYDERHPLNVYGQTKYEGELAVETYPKHFIIRIAWVFGKNGNNFIKTMLRLGKAKGAVSVVNDQIGNPTYTFDLAKLVVDMIQTDKYGTYHATNSGDFISWYDFACEIFKQAGMNDVEVTPVDSTAFPAKATRPKNSRMNQTELDKNGFKRLPAWQDALARYLKEIEY
ncbi:dTDP-4-dehydrorhamnose reductase [Faecalicoccus pleomorphus]|uniref:dTDP-4-dehydrorhamnose reductase n=1 Tax=Faecalicoccus pleomorphus TaxID=1323 RepID=UPI00232B50F6|nr:dTDP-4-dehydrorhamnose reductase [Faecalicoccus pleomorphus]MDB7989500.1 dTDP-4-dehydrorhamnose reductase [Faecalicoccus pleomorphus]MDB7993948.1 dTDP-4-dehydrorhamnose reductase [Faecalicoccus pleomorphus]